MEKYGFVYIWYDRKHKRYYIGMHWGHENDGYVSSSSWLKNAYKRRPDDFKRKILERVYTNRKDLCERELYWLGMIKPEELKVRYYNCRKDTPTSPLPERRKGARLSEEHKAKISAALVGKPKSEEHVQKVSAARKGTKFGPQTEERKRKASQSLKGRVKTEEHRAKISATLTGRKKPPRSDEEIAESKIKAKLRWKTYYYNKARYDRGFIRFYDKQTH